ncbi:helix-turn-helix domain-containing protein [Paenibacillus xylaniclasticus]|uniref:helix-turn-helix domain-containing protein n=1 Tax=Paenibacillus xylaniclasticus TaxID=588083 RepID=UPI000FD71ABD|nr:MULTISPECIES: AraC family transcriptional regulator [Paenibacillus]GFN29881.1 hypothetical protein PCURB6_01410 [Paenibacillus curdlanolyticus]
MSARSLLPYVVQAVFRNVAVNVKVTLPIWAEENKNQYVLICVTDAVTITTGKQTYYLPEGGAAIGNVLEIHNESQRINSIQYAVIELNKSIAFDYLPLDANCKEQREIIQSVFAFEEKMSNVTTIKRMLEAQCYAEMGGVYDFSYESTERLVNVHLYIQKKYYLDLSLEMLAERVNCNPVYLCNAFTKKYGVSPMKMVQQLRMEAALKMLVSTNKPLSQICSEVGFYSVPYFSTLFKKYYGESPKRYRDNFLISRKQ